MQKLFKKLLFFIENSYIRPLGRSQSISADDRIKIREKIAESNILRLAFLAAALFFVEAVILAFNFIDSAVHKYEALHISLYILMMTGLFIFAILLLVAGHKESVFRKIWTSRVFLLMLTLTMSAHGVLDMLTNGSIVRYLLILFTLILFPVLNIYEIILLAAIPLAAFISFSVYSEAYAFPFIYQIIAMAPAAVITSYVMYKNYVNRFLVNLRLEEKNQELVKMNKQLEEMSQTDSLTGLLNRRGASTKIERLWARCLEDRKNVCVVMADIDFFKAYNDTFGHDNGDECLRLISFCLKEKARNESDVISRYGGEEFLLVFENIGHQEAVGIAKRIKDAVEAKKVPSANTDASRYVTLSFGIAMGVPSESASFESILKAADIALYTAKDKGRNCIAFNDSLYR